MEEQELLLLLKDPKTYNQGFSMMLQQYQKPLYNHVRNMIFSHEDTQDVLQNVWLKVNNNISKFRADSKLYSWLYRIASNECYDFLKKKQHNLKESMSDYQENKINNLTSDIYFDGDELTILLHKAILKLPEKQQMVFRLRYFEALSYQKIAEITQTSESALKTSYHIATKKIETILKTSLS